MKTLLLTTAVLVLLVTGCAAPAEQIITITAESTPEPAVTPVAAALSPMSPSAAPSPAVTPVPAPTESTPIPTAAPTPKPTEHPTPSSTPEPTAEPTPEPTDKPDQAQGSSALEDAILSIVNSHRSANGLSGLNYSSAMQAAADTRARECLVSFSHTRPDGSSAHTALTEKGISFTAFGENLFASSGMDSVAAEFVVEQWMASSGHRENILRDGFTSMCIGIASQGDKICIVQLFGAGIS